MTLTIEERVIQLLSQKGINFIVNVPGEEINTLQYLSELKFNNIRLPREEGGVGICAGSAMAGAKPAMIVQSGGIGNMLNAVCSLTKLYNLPLLMLFSWRGVYKEKIEAQKAMGMYIPKILKSCDIPCYKINNADGALEIITQASNKCFNNNIPVGILLSPKIWETLKNDKIDIKYPSRQIIREMNYIGTMREPEYTRYEILNQLSEFLIGKATICNIGDPSRELYQIADRSENFYMIGSYGMVSAIGLGVTLHTKKEVVVIDGDGSILYNLNILATIGTKQPENLTIVLIDNGVYGSTGCQISDAFEHIDLESVARTLGIKNTCKAYSGTEVGVALSRGIGPRLIHVIALPFNHIPRSPPISITPMEIKLRFMNFLNNIEEAN